MKIGFSLWGAAFLLWGCTLRTEAQTRVSREPQPPKAVVEEFTGINCGNCPAGAAVLKELKQVCDTSLYIISVHAGSYADPGEGEPDFRTKYGTALLDFAGDPGFPSAMVQRRQTDYETSLAIYRGNWTKAVKSVVESGNATLNLWVGAELNASTRQLEVTVEYYPFDGQEDFLLNVALLQNHIIGYQNQGGADYSHEHVLRDLVTGQWGDTIKVEPMQARSIKYICIVPAEYTGIEADIRNLEIVVFATGMDKKDIINAGGCFPKIFNLEEPAGVAISPGSIDARYAYTFFPLDVRNTGNEPIYTIGFSYTTGGQQGTALWEGEIPPYQTKEILVDVGTYELQETGNEVELVAETVNGNPTDPSRAVFSFDGTWDATPEVFLELKTDQCGDEVSYCVRDREGKLLYGNGPFEADRVTSLTDTIHFPDEGIYSIEFNDSWHDGWQEGSKGSYTLRRSDGKLLKQNFSISGRGEVLFFSVSSESGNTQVLSSEQSFPVFLDHEVLRVMNPSGIRIETIEVHSTDGKLLKRERFSSTGEVSLPLSGIASQILLVRINSEKGFSVKKILKSR